MNGIVRDERGQAMVEFAVYLPVFVLLILFAFYVAEVGIRHVEAECAVRHATWHAVRVPGGGFIEDFEDSVAELEPPDTDPDMEDGDSLLQEQLSDTDYFASQANEAYTVSQGYTYTSKYFSSDFDWSSYSFTKTLVLDPAGYDTTQVRYGTGWDEFKTDYACALGYEAWQGLHETEEWSELKEGLLDVMGEAL